jgi:protein-arginine kinase activator protein McsA
MAVRCSCPIFTFEFILETAGVVVEETEEEAAQEKSVTKKKRSKPKTYKELSMEDLNSLLEKMIQEEDYEKAAKIRDEIARRGDTPGTS